jgi:hypothetical protein
MSDKAARRHGQHRAIESVAAFPLPGFPIDVWGPALCFNAECNAALHEGFLAFSKEWQEFLSKRMTEDLALLRRAGSAESPEQLWGAYAAFWQKAAEDYSEEYGKAAKLAAGLMSRSMTLLQRRMEGAATEIRPLQTAA